jgi:hypothetical protein
MSPELREALDRVHEGGRLVGVDLFCFENDPKFVTAVRFRFDTATVTFLTVADDDTVTAVHGPVSLEENGGWVDVSREAIWVGCIGREVDWTWCMTNHRGFTDAVRIEFGPPDALGSRIVELVVVASGFEMFVANRF